jgi:two-component system chemotaxis sensor kinase CheA
MRSQAKLEASLEQMSTRLYPMADATADLRTTALHLRRFEKDLFLNIAKPKKVAEYKEKWLKTMAHARGDIAKLEKLSSQEDRKFLAEVSSAFSGYESVVLGIIPRLGASGEGGITEPAQGNHAIEPFKEGIRKVDTSLETLGGLVVGRVEKGRKELNEQTEANRKLGTTLFVVVALVGTILFAATSLSITRAVRNVVKMLEKVKEGDLSARNNDAASDEIGAIAQTLDSTIAEVESSRDRIRQSAVAMRRVLDSVDQAMLLVHADGTFGAERSRLFDEWFGAPDEGETIDFLGNRIDASLTDPISMGWDQLRDGFLPLEMLIDQMPKVAKSGEKDLSLRWQSLCDETGAFQGCLLLISDVTAEMEQRRARAVQSEVIALMQRHIDDPSGVEDFMHEAERLASELHSDQDLTAIKRRIHTLKGNSAIFGLEHLAELCHQIEDEILDAEQLNESHGPRIRDAVEKPFAQARLLLKGRGDGQLDVHLNELQEVVEGLVEDPDLKARLLAWKHEPLQRMFLPLSRDAIRVAERLGKPGLDVAVMDGGIRLPRPPWRTLFASLTHAVRNAIDHGIEEPDERASKGKCATGTVTLKSEMVNETLVITVKDDGRGIDWEKLRVKAQKLGHPHKSQNDLVEALFMDGVSTKDQVSDVSGRGVGMAALRAEVRRLKGNIQIKSELGRGTELRISVPTKRETGRGSIAPKAA